MKKIVYGIAMTALMGGMFASCSNEVSDLTPGVAGKKGLVHAPDIYAWSGSDHFGTRSSNTRSSNGVTVVECKTSVLDRGAEEAFVNERLPEKNGNLDATMNTNGLFYTDKETSFEMYPVFSQTHTPNDLGLFYYDADGNYHTVIIWENMDPWNLTETEYGVPVESSWVEDPNYWDGKGGYYTEFTSVVYSKGIRVTVPAGCTFGFYWKGNLNNETNPSETTYYSDAEKNETVYRTDGGGNHIQPEETEIIHFVSFEANGKTYAGLEDWTDFDYQDWVFTFDQILLTEKPAVTPDPETPETPEEPNEDPETPELTGTPYHNNEVEVNFSINDVHYNQLEDGTVEQKYDNADLWTKLSIHVRKGTDVKIVIPIEGKYLCESDDFAIFQNHELGINTGDEAPHFDNQTHSMTYDIYDADHDRSWSVTLYVEVAENAITVTTDGINQDLIDYLFEKNGDGINFEVWNYYQTEVAEWLGHDILNENEETIKEWQHTVKGTLTEGAYRAFQGILNNSTIEFLDEAPEYYINAFGFEYDNGQALESIHPRHCLVTPTNTAIFGGSPFKYYCYHLNGTPWNIMWINNNAERDTKCYKAHTTTPENPVYVPYYRP